MTICIRGYELRIFTKITFTNGHRKLKQISLQIRVNVNLAFRENNNTVGIRKPDRPKIRMVDFVRSRPFDISGPFESRTSSPRSSLDRFIAIKKYFYSYKTF